MKPLVLVDGTGYLFRAFFALPPLTTSGGQPTGAVRGVLSMLYKLLDDYEPERVAVVFDAPGKTFRDDLYSDYKANRPPFPPDLRAQIEPLLEAVEAMGLAVLRIEGVEADDVIGTLADRASRAGLTTVISTSDKDMAQLVDERTSLINTMTGVAMGPEGVQQKFGVPPAQIIDYLALVGDTVDNIPGIPKVGPKTAAVVLSFALGMPAMPVDTHIHRVALRLGLIRPETSADDAHDVLEEIVPPDDRFAFHVLLINHGRRICKARRPLCGDCPLQSPCPGSQTSP